MTNPDESNENNSHNEMEHTLTGFQPWLAFYSLSFVVAGLYTLSGIASDTNKFPAFSAIVAVMAVTTGVLLWLRMRVALRIYIILAVGLLGFAVFRYATAGYTNGRIAMMIGSLMMFAGYSSIAEELPPRRP